MERRKNRLTLHDEPATKVKSQKKHQSKKPYYGHHKKRKSDNAEKEEIEQPSTSAAYRDRAKERREGINKDFDLDPDDFIFSNPVVGNDAEGHRQKIEDSKFLGGDVEHTHLVKGLDFALLEKIKAAEQQQQQQRSANQRRDKDHIFDASDSDEEELTKEAILAANATTSKRGQINIENLRTSDIITCRTALARRILKTLDERPPERSDLFLPGRMSYVVPLDEDADNTVTTILRSKAEQESEPLNEKDLAFDQLINIFTKIRQRK